LVTQIVKFCIELNKFLIRY